MNAGIRLKLLCQPPVHGAPYGGQTENLADEALSSEQILFFQLIYLSLPTPVYIFVSACVCTCA